MYAQLQTPAYTLNGISFSSCRSQGKMFSYAGVFYYPCNLSISNAKAERMANTFAVETLNIRIFDFFIIYFELSNTNTMWLNYSI